MACRGVFFAITDDQLRSLLEFRSDSERLYYVQEVIEASWDEQNLLETDKAWDAIHRCLTDGTLNSRNATSPSAKLILGGRQLYSDTQSYIINLIQHEELLAVAESLRPFTKDVMKSRYQSLRSSDYPQEFISDDDFEYTWEYFEGIPQFIKDAASAGRSVIFTVDQ